MNDFQRNAEMSESQHLGESGPLERSHIKGMVLKNALESAALIKTSRHLECQKRAFVRQTTRDADEMKNMLHRLHLEQHVTSRNDLGDDGALDSKLMSPGVDSQTNLLDQSTDTDSVVSNPYPVTIVPRYGAASKESKLTVPKVGLPGSRGFRRKSVEYEDIQESLTSVAELYRSSILYQRTRSDSMSSSSRDSAQKADWLGSPDAISSVRRMRKTVPEQSFQKICRKLSNESQQSLDLQTDVSQGICIGKYSNLHAHNLREQPKRDSDSDSPLTPRKALRQRKSHSFKIRKSSNMIDVNTQPLDMQTQTISNKTYVRPLSERLCDTKHTVRMNTIKLAKQPVTRKLSNDSAGWCEDVRKPRRKNSAPFRLTRADFM